MTTKIALLLGVHAHQPVGNFESVLEDAHRRCYGPFLRLMARFPDFPFAFHGSGWLMEYLHKHHPDDMDLLRTMVARGQAELFSAGYTEPVLAAIPARDRLDQLARMAEHLSQTLGETPEGAWLTERVWESTVVPALAASGIRYVTVDDYHFLCAGKSEEQLTGYFTTEEEDHRLDIFPISEGLRYRIPFTPAAEVVAHLEGMARSDRFDAAVYFDDIEKFGIWPHTYEWVYEKGWLEQFIRGVLASTHIVPMRYRDYHAQNSTRGIVYLPTTSYIEMNEWSLPAQPADEYASLVECARREGRYERHKAFLRGGIWRNFFMRYPESNWMHKRMLGLSRRFNALPLDQQLPSLRDALHESQANDAYWHGLFGGLYLPHLRRAIHAALIRLEAGLDRLQPRPARQIEDIDLDGHAETLLNNSQLQAIISGEGRADLVEFDSYTLTQNFADTLTRQREHYHAKVLHQQAASHSGGGIANPHESVTFKDPISPADLIFDPFRPALFTDYHGPTAEVIHYCPIAEAESVSKTPAAAFKSDPNQSVRIQKSFVLIENRLIVTYHNDGDDKLESFETRLHLAMPSCDGPAGRIEHQGRILGGFGQPQQLAPVKRLDFHDEVLGGRLLLSANHPFTFESAPCHSISQSEAGFEKIMQALTVRLIWSSLAPGQTLTVTLEVQSLPG